MIDLRKAKSTIAIEFTLPTQRAMQCPAPDPTTGEFYVSQADGTGTESIVVSRQSATGTKRQLLGSMRLEKAGHGTTISVLHRNGVLGVVVNAWGKLSWIPWRKGTVRKGDASVQPIWRGSYAYIDHEAGTVCLRGGSTYKLYELVGDTLGEQIGKTTNSVTPSGPGQGYCTLKDGTDFLLITMWGYGKIVDKPTIAVGSFTTGGLLYRTTARVLSKTFLVQEPESGFGLKGVFHLGMSARRLKKHPYAIKMAVPKPPPPVPPKPASPLHGNDVSSHQGAGWKPTKGDGFAFVKATQGSTYTNPVHAVQVKTARGAGLVVGHYHFLHPGNAVKQARFFVKQAGVKPGEMTVCDWETTPDGHPSVDDAAQFIAEVRRLLPKNRCLLYCNRSDWTSTKVKAPDGLWIAERGVTKPNTTTDWIFHQYTDKPIDQNRSKFTSVADLKKWAAG